MKCCACDHDGEDFIKIRQIGVNNYLITGEVKEPEISFKTLICSKCGSLQVDLSSIKTKMVYGAWERRYEQNE